MVTVLRDLGAAPMTVASGGLLWGLLGAAVLWDVLRRRIPNPIPVTLALAGVAVHLWTRSPGIALLSSLGGLLTGFVVWLPLYVFRLTGAADLKLAAAAGTWLGPLGALWASLYAALVGGLLALLWLWRSEGLMGGWVFLRTFPQRVFGGAVALRATAVTGASVPYALAIAAGVALELFGASLLGGMR